MAEQSPQKLRIQLFSIQTKTTLLLILLSLLTVGNYLFVLSSDNVLEANASTIEISRQNEVLAQKLGTLATLVYNGNEESKKELQKAITTHDLHIDLLEKGGEFSLAERRLRIYPVKEQARVKLLEAKEIWRDYRENLYVILNQAPQVTQIDSVLSETGQKVYNVRKVPNKIRRDAFVFVQDNTVNLFNQNVSLSDLLLEAFFRHRERANVNFTIVFVVYVLLFLLAYYQLVRAFVRPINRIAKTTRQLADGDLSVKLNIRRSDEVGRLASDINRLAESLRATSNFALAIGEHQFDEKFEVRNENDRLGIALLAMRDSLRKIDEESEKRRWFNEGITKFNDILRVNFDNYEDFAYEVIHELVKYLDMAQGGFFSLEKNPKTGEEFLRLSACHAYDRRRFEEKEVSLDDGLLAQAVIEKDAIYLTEIPEEYAEINSGLGGASPTVILIVPLLNEREVFGALELASFQKLPPHKIDFVKKIAETVVATIANVRLGEQTRHLLEDAQDYAQQMRSQEEEMRQNMEELAATQEALEKREREKTESLEKLKADYDARLEEIYQKERLLREQKLRLQDALDAAYEQNKQIEKQQAELRITIEKFKNKEELLNKQIQAKDKEIEILQKELDALKP